MPYFFGAASLAAFSAAFCSSVVAGATSGVAGAAADWLGATSPLPPQPQPLLFTSPPVQPQPHSQVVQPQQEQQDSQPQQLSQPQHQARWQRPNRPQPHALRQPWKRPPNEPQQPCAPQPAQQPQSPPQQPRPANKVAFAVAGTANAATINAIRKYPMTSNSLCIRMDKPTTFATWRIPKSSAFARQR